VTGHRTAYPRLKMGVVHAIESSSDLLELLLFGALSKLPG
jgi:hypothetical protein